MKHKLNLCLDLGPIPKIPHLYIYAITPNYEKSHFKIFLVLIIPDKGYLTCASNIFPSGNHPYKPFGSALVLFPMQISFKW
jgi:hypothetical protein